MGDAMRKSWLLLIILLAIAGMLVSGYSLKLYYQVQSVGFDQPSFCNFSPTMNCEVVQASAYASLAGLPVSGLGLCFYIFIFIMALAAWIVPTAAHSIANFGWLMGLGTFLYSAFLAYVSATILRVWCPTCIVMYAVNFLVWMAWWWGGHVHPARVLSHLSTLWKWSLGFVVVVGVGAVFMLSKSQAMQRVTPAQLKDALYAFQRGSVYTLPTDWTNHPMWGNPNAKITIVEFSDFECPFCRVAALNFLPTLIDYQDKVRLVFVNYPLDQSCNKNVQMPMHQHACQAAVGAMCAYSQGQFWGFSEELFRNQRRISREVMLQLAEKHRLDLPKFTQCLDAQESLPMVTRDIDIGEAAQVRATPSIFVNGRQLQNWRSPQVVREVLDAELAKVK
jgi:protein-disulfide isomerase/uncharacterized membrane protein